MPVPSPCKLICMYDKDGLCAGCHRNKEEIMNWIMMSDRQKLEVYKNIKTRRSGNSN